MKLYEAIFERRTVHNYLDEPVPTEVIKRCLEAAHMAPNHKMTWPWKFTVVGKQSREKIVPIAYALKNAKTPSMTERIRAKLMNPGALIVVSHQISDDAFLHKEDYAATCCAIQNLMLAAKAEGFGSKWSTGGITRHPEVYNLLGINEHEEEIIGFIWVGTPSQIPEVERPALDLHIQYLD